MLGINDKDKQTRQSRTLFVPNSTKEFWKNFSHERQPGESFENYKDRRKKQTGVLKWMKKRSLRPKHTKKGIMPEPFLTGGNGSKYFRQSLSTKP